MGYWNDDHKKPKQSLGSQKEGKSVGASGDEHLQGSWEEIPA